MYSNTAQMFFCLFFIVLNGRIIQCKFFFRLHILCIRTVFLVLCGCLIDGLLSPFNDYFFKYLLYIRAKALIFELNKFAYIPFIEFKYESSSPLHE